MPRFRPSRLALLLAGCLAFSLSAPAAQPEEYSPSGGRTAGARIPAGAADAPPRIPKNLAELQFQTGPAFHCLQRENFLVAANLAPADCEYLVDGVLDFCRAAMTRTYFDRAAADKTVNIYVFRDYGTYETGLRDLIGMEPISPYGHYGHTQKYIVVNYETGPGTMVHELTHALMSEDFPEAPIWLAEGMASLYEHCRAEGPVLKGDDNWRLPELQDALERGVLTPLGRLFSMTPAVFRGERESLNYAQARYFCKYLEELGVLPGLYKTFRGKPHLDPTGGRFVSKALGQPLGAVEEAWRRWIAFQYWME